ncbi:hypothetical protein C1646_774231 [Rhizophagus diaphanus]|nr:hypothetical protein C1646_774231 [Rhizophagus diaphanus] [Rhizophagus sp. MUCL 43196]
MGLLMYEEMATSSTEKNTIPTSEEVGGYSVDELNSFLQEWNTKRNFGFSEDTLKKLKDEEVSGYVFLNTSKEEYQSLGLRFGPAKILADFANEIAKKNTGKVHVFVDNSNLFIGARYTVGKIEKVYDPDKPTEESKESEESEESEKPKVCYMQQLQIDYGCLLTKVLDERKLGGNPVIVGSRPPPQDTLWNRIKDLGYNVIVYNRNLENKEKCVDMQLGTTMVDDIADIGSPGIVVLVAGDGDYEPAVEKVLRRGWIVEIWFWKSSVSRHLTNPEIFRTNKELKVIFKPLDTDYQHFTYGYGISTAKKYILEAKHDTIRNWKNEDVMKRCMKCCMKLKIFCWWNRETEINDTIKMYFTNKTQLEEATHWFNNNFPDIETWGKINSFYQQS